MKHEWKKAEKSFYLPAAQPSVVQVPPYHFVTLRGKGDPNEPAFGEAVGALYALAYGVKMLPKKGIQPDGYFEYAIYPLEGLWWLAQPPGEAGFQKADLEYKIMIRQPDFVTQPLFCQVLELVRKKQLGPLLEQVQFEQITDGLSIQMLHHGAFELEQQSFGLMDRFCELQGYKRTSHVHREIYLNDARKTTPDKRKTVLRYTVEEIG